MGESRAGGEDRIPLERTRAEPGALVDVSLAWLVTLRWITQGGQFLMVLLGGWALPGQIPLAPLLGLATFGLLSNLGLWLYLRRTRRPHPALSCHENGGPPARMARERSLLEGARTEPGHPVCVVLVLDVLLLTGLLAGSGGPSNPFTVLYLVQVTLGAVVARWGWAWLLTVLSTACYGLLFMWHLPVPCLEHMGHGEGGLSLHLAGMWVAFALTAALIALFVGRVTEALRRREGELADLRELSSRQAHLAALTTLAAGAAHELGSPLGTISVVATELVRASTHLGAAGVEVGQDAELIRQEVGRCRSILDQMAHASGSTPGEALVPLVWEDLERDLREGTEEVTRVRFRWPKARLQAVPRRGLARSLRALLCNALEAGPGEVWVEARQEGGDWILEVKDQGAGMTEEVRLRAAEPFFTTRGPEAGGRGMGLGLFLARTFAEQLGGELMLRSELGRGTRVALRWRDLEPEGAGR